jgi:acetyltransferase-like isoleucine patch superfamily enzyme
VCIFDSDYHPIYNDKFERINDNKAVIIGDNCWVGANSMVLKGAVLDNGCIVSANSMVMGNVDENKVYINKREAKSVGENVVWKM